LAFHFTVDHPHTTAACLYYKTKNQLTLVFSKYMHYSEEIIWWHLDSTIFISSYFVKCVWIYFYSYMEKQLPKV